MNKDKRKQPASIRVEPIIGKTAQVDWKEDFKLTNKNGELFVINLFLMRLHYSKKFYARLTIDKKRDEVKTCIIESLEYFNGSPREIWFDNMATVMVKEGKHKKVHNEIKQLGNDIAFIKYLNDLYTVILDKMNIICLFYAYAKLIIRKYNGSLIFNDYIYSVYSGSCFDG